MKSFFSKIKIFRFWPKTMDYNKAFWPKSRSFFVVLLLQNGRCYEAEVCAILLLLRCPFQWNPFFAKVKIFRFWPKTMDYNKAFWPKSRSSFVVLLLQNVTCYEAQICAILLLLRCPFRWNPFFCQSQNFHFQAKEKDIIMKGISRGAEWSKVQLCSTFQ